MHISLSNDLSTRSFADASLDTSGEKEEGRKKGRGKKNRFEVGLIGEQIHGGR